MKKKSTLLLFIFLFVNSLFSQNLIVNGDFETGGSGTGFVTNGAGYTLLNAPYSGTTATGNYARVQNANTINTTNFIFEGDHTNGTLGYMLAFDGNATAGNPRFWQAGSAGAGITSLTIGTTYRFSYWIKSISNLGSPADISVQVTGGTSILTSGTTAAPAPGQSWRQVIYTIVATATTVQIELWNTNTAAVGNDFAVDDFMLTDDLMVTANVTNAACATAADGGITVSGFGGTPPYVNYTIAGPVNQNNTTTGIFSNLPPGIYTVTVTDSSLPTAQTATLTNVVVGPHITVTNNTTTTCGGTPVSLNAAGSPSGYTWTASPADPTLTTPNIANPTVSPAVTTVYTVRSTVGSCAPISNTVTVTVTNPRPTVTITNTPACAGAPLVLTITANPSPASGTYSYVWTVPAGETNPGNVASFTATTAGSYSVIATNTTTTCSSVQVVKNIIVNPLPVANITGNNTICPGNTSVITITGTPLSTATLVDNFGTTYTKLIPASGTVTFTTPVLNVTTTYCLVSVKGFSTFCQTNYTGVCVTINVVPNGCATVETVPAPGTAPLDLTLCTTGECRTLQANVSPVPSTISYSVAPIPFCPQAAFENPSWNNILPGGPIGDDDWSAPFSFPAGMNFCFYGQNYTQLNVGTNQVIHFPNPALFAAGDYCPWAYSTTIPNAAFPITNAIFGVYQDTDFSVTPPPGVQISVNYNVVGTYPCRKFIANFANCPQFSCGNTIGLSTSQIVLYEVSNIIEVYVQRRVSCTGWNGGRGTIGVINGTGTQAVAAPGRNAAPFSTDPTPSNITNTDNVSEAWRFTPTGPPVSQTVNWYQGPVSPANFIGTGPTIQVCPTATTTYTLETVYNVCGVPQTASNTVTLNVNPDLTNAPVDITQCSTTFDLTTNASVVLGSLNPADYDITYHLTAADAATISSPITTPNAFVSSGQTIYMAIYLNAYGCTVVKPFDLIVVPCGAISPVPDLTLCESSLGSGTASFDLSPQTAIALGSQNPADYTITYYTSQTAANNGTPGTEISPINPFVGTNQTIYIRMEDNTVPTTYYTTDFDLIVNPLPTATISGTTTICSGTSTVITFTGTPGATVNYTVGGNPDQAFLNASGSATVTTPNLTNTLIYTLISIVNPITTCSRNLTGSATVTVRALPTATISGTTTVCKDSASPNITFTGANGTAPYTFTYSTDGGTTVVTTPPSTGNTYTLPVSTALSGIFTYTLISVQSSGVPACSQNQSGTAAITVTPLPTATISGTTVVCLNAASPNITFTGANGTAPYTFTYSTDGGTTLVTTPPSTGNTYTIPVSTATIGAITYTLISVQGSGTPACSQNQSGSATVTINALPTATISGTTTVCKDSASPNITFTGANGTAPYTFTYSTDGGTTLLTTGPSTGNTYLLPASTATVGATAYTLISVQGSGTPACSQNQSGTATVTVTALPTATISGTTTVCKDSASPNITFTGANGTAPYTFTYSTDGGTTVVTTPPSTGNTYTLPVSTALSGTFTYTLISVQSSGVPACSQNQSGTAAITVNPLPTATISGTTVVCLNAASPNITFTGANGSAPYTFTYSTDGGTTLVTTAPSTGNSYILPVPTAASGSFTYTLISVRDGASPSCSQPQVGSATVTVNTAPVIGTPAPYVVCDDSLDNTGFYCGFDLTTKDIEVSSDPTVVITYHETQTDADIGGTTIPVPTSYCNLNPFDQIIYVRASFTGSSACYTTTSFHLIVNPIPLPNPVITDYELCDYNNPGDGIEVFDLGTKTPEIANGQSGVTVSYYATLADAQGQANPLPNLYPNTVNPQRIWINIRDNATGCNTTGSFNLIVHPLPVLSPAPDLNQCSNGSSTTAEFNLSVNEGTVTNNVGGMIVTYYNTLAAAQNGSPTIAGLPSAYTGFDTEVVYIRVENSATGCYSTTTQLLRVTQGPVAITPQPLHYCDPNNDGFGVFDLQGTVNEITGTPPGSPLPAGVSVTFHETLTDSQLGANPKPSPYYNITVNTQVIYVRVYYTLTGCANYVQLQLIVDPTPVATEPDDYELCDYTGAAGYEAFDLNTRIPEVLGSLDPTLNTVTFYTSLADAQAPSNAIAFPGSYVNATVNTQTIYIRVETDATGCYDIVTLQLIVNPLPNATQPNYPQYSLCDTTGATGFEVFDLASQVTPILLGQSGMDVTFYPSLSDAQNNTNAITSLQYTNAIIYVQTLGIRITNHDTGCYAISTMDIRVEPLPTPVPPTQPYTVCDDDQDGFANFDLASLIPGLLNGMTTYTITFHETIADAANDANPINTSVPYFSINPFVQIVYVRAEDNATGCYSILPIELNADPSPVAPVNLGPITVCDQDSNPQDAITAIDLTQRTADALAQQTGAAANYSVTYYTSLLLAQGGTSPIIQASNYTGSNGQTIWVRVEHNTTHCFNIGSFLLQINTPLLLTTPAPLSLCDDDTNPNDQHHSFNLTVKDTEINQATGYAVTYYPSLSDAQSNTGAITTPGSYVNIPPAVQTLGVAVTTTAGCRSITTLDIRVLPIPTPNTNPPPLAPKCDDNSPGDMLEYFDLTLNAAYIANNDPNVTLHYFATQGDAIANIHELIPANHALVGTNVWIRVENNRVDYQGNNCYVLVEQPLKVNPLPTIVQPLPPYRACDDNADGIAVFDLANPDLAPAILGTVTTGQQPADYTISYYLTQSDATAGTSALPSSYTNATPNAQDIYIRVVNKVTGCVNTGILPLAVEAYAQASGPQAFNECDNYTDPYDGVALVDLTGYAPAILNGQDPAVFLVSYYTTLADAVAGTGALSIAQATAYVTDADTDTIWVRVENSSNLITPYCYALTTIDITVERYPNPVITTANNVTTICVDFVTGEVVRPLTLDSGIASPSGYTFEWFQDGATTPIPGATGPAYTVDTASPGGVPRSYTVTVTSASPLACQTTSTDFQVVQSGQAVVPAGSEGYTVTGAFSGSQVITVNIEGYGAPDYQYSLDDGPRQVSNVFEGVSMGTHVIHVWDTKGDIAYSCEELVINEVMVIDYPHYFTPNGDGIHDTWNIVGLDGSAKILIFDRYGKLLKQISPTGPGWNGTYNGHLLPSDDYWFTVDFIEGATVKQFKAHFSMKR